MIGTSRAHHATVVNAMAKGPKRMNDNFPECLSFTLQFEGGYRTIRRHQAAHGKGSRWTALCHELGRRASVSELTDGNNDWPARPRVSRLLRTQSWSIGDPTPVITAS